jgi:hypothetical protein
MKEKELTFAAAATANVGITHIPQFSFFFFL